MHAESRKRKNRDQRSQDRLGYFNFWKTDKQTW